MSLFVGHTRAPPNKNFLALRNLRLFRANHCKLTPEKVHQKSGAVCAAAIALTNHCEYRKKENRKTAKRIVLMTVLYLRHPSFPLSFIFAHDLFFGRKHHCRPVSCILVSCTV